MQKPKKLWLAGGLALILLVALQTIWSNAKAYGSMALPEFIIGTWEIQEVQSVDDYLIYELEFVDSNTLVADIDYPEGAYYNVVFRYSFVEENRIGIMGRTGDEWQIERKGDRLAIRSTSWPGDETLFVYKREIAISWPLIVLLIGTLIIGTYLAAISEMKREMVVTEIPSEDARAPRHILKTFGYLGLFLAGLLIGLIIWSWPPLLRIRLPWDSVVMFEVSVLCVIMRLLVIRATRLLVNDRRSSIERWLPILGFALLGIGSCGLGISLTKLTLFLVYKSYLI